ncbi:rhomboid family intramembrane serine protease, partial [Romboutsia ilealis]|nr:rhomboid family intramembrane serine protease [Romboutsia ilealis]
MEKNQKAVCTTALIVINIGVFLVLSVMGATEDTLFMLEHGAM